MNKSRKRPSSLRRSRVGAVRWATARDGGFNFFKRDGKETIFFLQRGGGCLAAKRLINIIIYFFFKFVRSIAYFNIFVLSLCCFFEIEALFLIKFFHIVIYYSFSCIFFQVKFVLNMS